MTSDPLGEFVDANLPGITLLVEAGGTILRVSRSVERIAGFTPDELVGTSGLDLIHPDDLGYALGSIAEAARNPGGHAAVELRFRQRSGEWMPSDVDAYNPPDDPDHFVVVVRDVSARPSMPERRLVFQHLVLGLAERCAAASAEGLADVIDGIAARVGEALRLDEIRIASVALDPERVTCSQWLRPGCSPRLADLTAPVDVEAVAEQVAHPGRLVEADGLWSIDQPVESGGVPIGLMTLAWHSEEALRQWDAGNGELLEAAARILIGTARRAQRVRTLSYQAMHDPLTGLANRIRLFSALDHEINRTSGRQESRLAVAYCDLDRFKTINDTYGHPAGDEVLVTSGTRLRDAVRSGDLVCRMGGDEFVVLCPEVDTEGEAFDIAVRMAAELNRPMTLSSGIELRVSGTIGIVVVRGHGRGSPAASEVIRRADEAMYEAKLQRERGIRLVTHEVSGDPIPMSDPR